MRILAISSAVLLALTACSTVTPVNVAPPAQIAFDGPYQDAGILRVVNAASGKKIGIIVTGFWVSTYKARVTKYGAKLIPSLTAANCMDGVTQRPDDPVRGPVWYVPNGTEDADDKMARMQRNLSP